MELKKAFLILLTFTLLFGAFVTGVGFVAVALFSPLIVPFIVSTFNGAVCVFSSKVLLSFVIALGGGILIMPFYKMLKRFGGWVKRKYKKVKGFFMKKFGKNKRTISTQTIRDEYPYAEEMKDDIEEVELNH